VKTNYKPYKLLITTKEVLKFIEVSSKLSVAYIAEEYPTSTSAAG
jgi:hypothetical protein